jgi:hypothetical protein
VAFLAQGHHHLLALLGLASEEVAIVLGEIGLLLSRCGQPTAFRALSGGRRSF